MPRILLVEDHPRLAESIRIALERNGMACDVVASQRQATAAMAVAQYAALILDRTLPDGDGLDLLAQLRALREPIPCMVLTARDGLSDRVHGLEAGADDYLTKPFAFSELMARVQALIRRASASGAEPTRLVAGDLTLDLLTREARRGTEKVELQPREFSLLEYLMRNAGRTVSKTMILEHVWDYSFDPQTNVVDVLVHRLRSKIDPDKTRLHTMRGVGYVLRAT